VVAPRLLVLAEPPIEIAQRVVGENEVLVEIENLAQGNHRLVEPASSWHIVAYKKWAVGLLRSAAMASRHAASASSSLPWLA